jgi:hypothetical protein
LRAGINGGLDGKTARLRVSCWKAGEGLFRIGKNLPPRLHGLLNSEE